MGRHRLVIAAFVSQIGNWLTFTGLMQYVQSHFGSSATAGTFLVQSVPALLAARALAQRVPRRHTHRFWLGAQLVLALCSASLAIGHASIWYVYVFFAVTALLRAIANPLYMSFVGDWVAPEERNATFTGVGTAGSITLVLAPAVGGVMAVAFGYSWLFLADAASFLLAALILAVPAARARRPDQPAAAVPAREPFLRQWLGRPSGIRTLAAPLKTWTWFNIAGAAVNAVELPVFSVVHHFDTAHFGFALACYGVGGLSAFVLSQVRPGLDVPPGYLSLGYLVGLVAWVFGGTPGAYVGFAVAGATYGLLSGRLRTHLDRGAGDDGIDSVTLWAWANQIVLIANVSVYGMAAAAFGIGVPVLWMSVATFAVTAGMTIRTRYLPVPRQNSRLSM